MSGHLRFDARARFVSVENVTGFGSFVASGMVPQWANRFRIRRIWSKSCQTSSLIMPVECAKSFIIPQLPSGPSDDTSLLV